LSELGLLLVEKTLDGEPAIRTKKQDQKIAACGSSYRIDVHPQ
jgi:hypothetical protein